MLKNKSKIRVVILLILVVVLIIVSIYFYGLTPLSRKSEKVIFTVKSGDSKIQIVDSLKKDKLIKSKVSSFIYLISHKNCNLKSGTYELNRNESTITIIKKLSKGRILDDSIKITFHEGKRLNDFVNQIATSYNINSNDIITMINDKAYLKELIVKYWFLTDDILNDSIYYALEGYLFPDTYVFEKDVKVQDIIIKMLDNTEKKLIPYKVQIEQSNYNIHDIITIASIIENESKIDEDRSIVSQVIAKRLSINMSLGMDVTTYYAAKKPLTSVLTAKDLNELNAYNTRNTSFIGLPVGPICNPSVKSIKAALNPSATNYLYFYADIKTGKLYFAEDAAKFQELIETYR